MLPLYNLAPTNAISVALAGNSRVRGFQDSVIDNSYNAGELARAIGPLYAYVKLGQPGETSTQAAGSFTNRARTLQYVSTGVLEYGINGMPTIPLATQVSNLTTLANLFGGKPVFGTTVYSENTSTDNFATTANQSVAAGYNPNVFNSYIRSGQIPGETGFLDVQAYVDPLNINVYPVAANPYVSSGTANFGTPDGVHLTSAAAVSVAARLIREAMAKLTR